MNKYISIGLLVIIVLTVGYYLKNNNTTVVPKTPTAEIPDTTDKNEIAVHSIMHASAVLSWDNSALYIDPVGSSTLFADMPKPQLIFITDIHPDHLSNDTLTALVAPDTVIVAPQAVADKLTPSLLAQTVVLANGSSTSQNGFTIDAIPMYNLPLDDKSFHTKGRGNGYVIAHGDKRVYVAGDTSDIPEMRALKNIDIAFIPMNLPYTMTVESAASGTLAFAPHHVYPYHYRGTDGFSDVNKFKLLVNEGNPAIDVVLLDWYPTTAN